MSLSLATQSCSVIRNLVGRAIGSEVPACFWELKSAFVAVEIHVRTGIAAQTDGGGWRIRDGHLERDAVPVADQVKVVKASKELCVGKLVALESVEISFRQLIDGGASIASIATHPPSSMSGRSTAFDDAI